jgi:prepilin-type N-terminal cleavage/methylation domain-containing protein
MVERTNGTGIERTMKTNTKSPRNVESRKSRVERKQNAAPSFPRLRPLSLDTRLGFTLIELLAVISIIGVLAAFTIPVVSSVKKQQYIKHTQAEMALLVTAIERYKAAYGFYPPCNTNDARISQLFYELEGTTNNNHVYQTLDGVGKKVSEPNVATAFSIGGFMNCSKIGAVEDTTAARNFLSDLKTKQYGVVSNGIPPVGVSVIIGSVGGPDESYQPFNTPDLNPWRYNSANPTNNPGAYDLYMQLQIGGKKYLICNWSKQVQINSSLP